MKRIYTDERFPGVEVVNFGDTKFLGTKDGQKVHEFVSHETDREVVSEAFAQRRARDYFEMLASHQIPPVSMEGLSEAVSVPAQIVEHLLND